MDALRNYAQNDNVRAFITQAVQVPGVHGVIIDVDPRWLALWQAQQAIGPMAFERLDSNLNERLRYYWPYLDAEPFLSGLGWTLGNDEPDVPFLDYSFSPTSWQTMAGQLGEPLDPFVVKILRAPTPNQAESQDIAGQLSVDGIRVRVETRPVAVALTSPKDVVRPLQGGVSIGSKGSRQTGTLGGLLFDAQGRSYGVTCGHVLAVGASVTQPASSDRKGHKPIGTVVARSTLNPPSTCAPYAADLDKIDVALIAIDNHVSAVPGLLGLGPMLGGVAPSSTLCPGRLVDVVGKETGLQTLRLGGLTVTEQVFIGGELQCFTDLMELRRLSRFYHVAGLLHRPVRAGDSGAWVLNQGPNGPEWCGTVLAGAGAVGYATIAEFTFDWLKSQVEGLTLAQPMAAAL